MSALRDELLAKYNVSPTTTQLPNKKTAAALAGGNTAIAASEHPIVTGAVKVDGKTQTLKESILSKYQPPSVAPTVSAKPITTKTAYDAAVAGQQNASFQPLDIPGQVSPVTATSGVSSDNIISGKENDGFTNALASAPLDFLNQMAKNVRASTLAIATIPAGIVGSGVRTFDVESKPSGISGVTTPATYNTVGKNTLDDSVALPAIKESLSSAKEMLLNSDVPVSKQIDEASQMYLKSRGVGKYGGKEPGLTDVAVIGTLGLFDLFGDPATAVGVGEIRALKEFATFRKVGTVARDLAEGTKVVAPIERSFNFGDNLMMKVKPKEGEVVFEGYVRRFPKQSDVVGALESGSKTATQDAEKVQQFISKLSEGNPSMEVKASIRGNDLVIKPQLTEQASKTFQTLATTVKAENLAQKPLDAATLEKISQLSPQETSAFGRKVVADLSQSLGIEIDPKNLNLPSDTFIKQTPSLDGRPAGINPATKQVEIYMPNLVKDLKTLSEGGKILAHNGQGSSKYAQVYKMNAGESMSQLATRYISDVLTHERAHLETITGADLEEQTSLQQQVNRAVALGNENKIIAAKTNLDKFMQGLEDKANKYVAENKVSLEQKIFLGKTIDTSKLVEKSTGVAPDSKPVTINSSEKTLLKKKLQKEQAVARRGASQGRSVGLQEQKNIQTTRVAQVQRQGELKSLKQNIEQRATSEKQKQEITNKFEKQIKTERSKFIEVIEKVNNKTTSIQAKRDYLTDLVKLLPSRARGKFLTAINSTTTDKKFLSTIDRIRETAQVEERANLLREIKKEIDKTKVKNQTGKFGPVAQRELDIIRRNLFKDYDDAQRQIIDLVDDRPIGEDGEAKPLTSEEQRQIERLQMQGVKDMDPKELRHVLDNIKSLKENGRSLREAFLETRSEQDDLVLQEGLRTITGDNTPLKKKKKVSVSMVPKNTFVQKVKNWMGTGFPGWDKYLNDLSFFDKTTQADESFLNTKFGRDVHEAGNKEFLGNKEQTDRLHEDVKKIFNVKSDVEVYEKVASLNKEEKLGEFRDNSGQIKELSMTHGQMVNLYIAQKMDRLEETIALQFTPEQLAAIDSRLTAEEKAWGDALIKFANDSYDAINAVFSKLTGYDLPRQDVYFPINRQGADLDNLDDMSLLEGEAKNARPTVKNRSLKKITKSILPLDLRNPYETMIWYTSRMEHFKAYAEAAREMKKFFNNPEVRSAITDYYSFDKYKSGQNIINTIIRGGIEKGNTSRVLSKLAGNFSSAMLAYNFHSAVGQLVDFFVYPLKVPAPSYFANVAKFWLNPKENYDFMVKNSVFLQERLEKGYSDEIRAALAVGDSGKMHFYGKAKRLINKLGFIAFEGVDRLISLPGMYSAYQYKLGELLKNGILPDVAKKDAMYFAESITKNLRESGRVDTKSELEMQSTLMKMLNLFRSQQAKYNGQMAQEIQNWRSGRQSKLKSAFNFTYLWLVLPLIYQFVANRDSSTKEKIGNAIVSPITNIPIAGNVAQMIFDNLNHHDYSYRPSVVTSFIDDIQAATKQLMNKKVDMRKVGLNVADAIGKFEGLPTPAITKIARRRIKAQAADEARIKKENNLKNKKVKFN